MARPSASIQQRFRRLSILTSGVALLAASVSFVAYDVRTFRRHFEHRLSAEADIVGANSVSALLFSDPSAARETLRALAAEPAIQAAAVYGRDGRLFARYVRAGARNPVFPDRPFDPAASPASLLAPLAITRPVVFEGATLGTVWLDSDIGPELSGRLLQYLLIVSLVLAGALAVAAVVSGRLQRTLTGPILALVDAARVVSRDKDYGRRVQAAAEGEVGLLVETFNEMLAAVEERDAALREARAQLEQKVQERTRELQQELQERRRAEEAREHSQALLARAEALAQIGSWELDPGGDDIRWSDQLYRLLGVGRDTPATYAALVAHVHRDDRERVEAEIERALRTGNPVTFEYRLERADGTTRVIQSQLELRGDALGAPARLLGTAQDVTERRQAENEREQRIHAQAAQQAAEEGERRTAVLAGVSAELVGSLDVDSTFPRAVRHVVPEFADWCSVHLLQDGAIRRVACASADAVAETLGWTMEARYPYRLDAPGGIPQVLRDGRPQLVEDLTDAFLSGMARGEHLEMLRKIGFRSAILVPLRARGESLGVVSFGMTTSDRRFRRRDLPMAESLASRIATALDNARLYREAQDANRMKDEFLATLSHELRTPLNAIVGWVQLLRLGALDEAGSKRAIETIDRNSRVQAQLIEDILDVSRIVSGKLSIELTAVDLASAMQAAVDSVRPAAEAKQIAVECELESGITVAGDADRLQQIFWNLLSNATKFTPAAGRIQVKVGRVGPQAEAVVTDNGSGIAPDFIPHVFERFRQGDSSSTRAHRGLGLGLAIVRHLTELQGGTVSVASDGEGRGASFLVRLPLGVVPVTPAKGRLAEGADSLALSGLRVMVVDDEPDTREVIQASLGRLGAQVQVLATAKEAMAALPTERPDVLVADIEMPGIDGYMLVRWLRTLSAATGGSIPALALTAYARPEDRRQALAAGFQAHLAKPVRPDEVARAIRRLAGDRSAATG